MANPVNAQTNNWTTRKFPRTLREAFPCDAKNAFAVEVYKPMFSVDYAIFCLVGVVLGILVLIGLFV